MNKASQDIENIYLRLGEYFPQIFKELEMGFAGSDLITATDRRNMDYQEKTDISEFVEKADNLIINASSYFLKLNDSDKNLFETIKAGIQRLNILKDRIEEIRQDSIEMELISMNAMTVAIKAGIEGKGFSFITEELKKLSNLTINYSEELNRHGEDMVTLFGEFMQRIQTIQATQQNIYGDFKDKLHHGFEDLNIILKEIDEVVKLTINEAKKIKQPLFSIMNELQLQDIIRQSLDHVLLCLTELEKEMHSDNDPIQYLGVIELITFLNIGLLDDITDKINKSFGVFNDRFSELKNILDEVEKKKQDFIEKTGDMNMSSSFNQSVSMIESLVNNISLSQKEKMDISIFGKIIGRDLNDLNEKFLKFTGIIDRFYNIEVVSRIEASKKEFLKKREEITTGMTNLTEKIESDVKIAISDIENSIDKTEMMLHLFSDKIVSEYKIVEDFLENIQGTKETLFESKVTLESSIRNFNIYTVDFLKLLEKSEMEIKNLHRNKVVIEEARNKLSRLHRKISKKKNELSFSFEKDKIDIKETRFKKMIEKFTILTHKKIAGEVAGMDIEEGDKGGKLTLF